MPDEVRLWQVGPNDSLHEIERAALDLETRLQRWLASDISVLDPELPVIGREVETDFGWYIDLLCIDPAGDLVVIELKRDRTSRESYRSSCSTMVHGWTACRMRGSSP